MAVLNTEMIAYLATTIPTALTTTTVGGAISATAFTGSLGQLIFAATAEAFGGSDVVFYTKFFVKNTNATDSVSDYGIWIANALDTISSPSTISMASSSVSDSSSKSVILRGFASDGTPQQETVALNGTSTVVSTLTFLGRVRPNVVNSSTLASVATAGDLTFTAGSEIGICPAGYTGASSEVDIGLASSLDDTATITNATTAPSGVTFSRPRVEASKLVFDGGAGVVAAGEAQGIWVRVTLVDGMLPTQPVDLVFRGKGTPV